MFQLKLGNIKVIFSNLQYCVCYEKYLKDSKHNSSHLNLKICSDICPWTLSVPHSSQFSLSFALGKLFAFGTDNALRQIYIYWIKWGLFSLYVNV